jgi:hypothetical protein
MFSNLRSAHLHVNSLQMGLDLIDCDRYVKFNFTGERNQSGTQDATPTICEWMLEP